MSDSNAPLLSVENLDVHFGSDTFLDRMLGNTTGSVEAVDGVSFDVHENEVIALVGESGCGKTTLGKTAVGLQSPTAGTVKYRGQDIWGNETGDDAISREEIRRSLQIIHQDPGSSLDPNKTVKSLLSAPLKRWHDDMNAGDREATIFNLLDRLSITPIDDYSTRYPHQLSGGEKQRIALGRALLMQPNLILADEAVSALDVSLRVEMMDLMLDLQEEFGTSYLYISHDFANARYLAKKSGGRIGVMYLGEIVEIGSADDVLEDPKHPYTQVLDWATPALDPEKAKKSAEEDPPVRSVDIPDPSNPPEGCRFHTRCPKARGACKKEPPELLETAGGREAACFRVDDNHEYWDSPELTDS